MTEEKTSVATQEAVTVAIDTVAIYAKVDSNLKRIYKERFEEGQTDFEAGTDVSELEIPEPSEETTLRVFEAAMKAYNIKIQPQKTWGGKRKTYETAFEFLKETKQHATVYEIFKGMNKWRYESEKYKGEYRPTIVKNLEENKDHIMNAFNEKGETVFWYSEESIEH